MGEDNGHRVEAIAEVMSDHGQRDDEAEPRARLKANPDRDPVKKAVHRQPGGAEHAELGLVLLPTVRMLPGSVEGRVALEGEKGEESPAVACIT